MNIRNINQSLKTNLLTIIQFVIFFVVLSFVNINSVLAETVAVGKTYDYKPLSSIQKFTAPV